jgi:ATP-dependent DNA ligase
MPANLPAGDAWEYELNLDGYRTLAVKHAGSPVVGSV